MDGILGKSTASKPSTTFLAVFLCSTLRTSCTANPPDTNIVCATCAGIQAQAFPCILPSCVGPSGRQTGRDIDVDLPEFLANWHEAPATRHKAELIPGKLFTGQVQF